MTHMECKIAFIGFVNEVWKVGSLLIQKQQELGHSSTSYAILNLHVCLLASHLYPFQSILNAYICAIQWTQCHLKPSYTSLALKLNC